MGSPRPPMGTCICPGNIDPIGVGRGTPGIGCL